MSGFNSNFRTAVVDTGGTGGGGIQEYADYDSIPDGSDGDTVITTNNNQFWRFSSVAGCWIPNEFYDSGLAIQQDRSVTPKDLDFKTPQVSDFSGLSGYSTTGTVTDNASSITLTSAPETTIQFTRETHTGDSLLIADVTYTATGTASYQLQGFRFASHTNQILLSINFCGPNRNQSNTAFLFRANNAPGTLCRPTSGVGFTAGSRVFMKWNNADLASRTTDKFVDCLIQDKSDRIRSIYTSLETGGSYYLNDTMHLMAWDNDGSLEISRFQVLKYT